MANNPQTTSVLKITSGSVQVYPQLPTRLLDSQDGSDVGTGGPALATFETVPLGSFFTNRVIEFLDDRFCLTRDSALATSGVYKKNQGGAGQWGRVQGGGLTPSIDGSCCGLHVLHPDGIPTLAYLAFHNSHNIFLHATVDGTSGSNWGTGFLTLESNGSQPNSHGSSIVFRNSIVWSHKSFAGAAGTGSITQYDLKTGVLTRHQPTGIGTNDNHWPSQIAFHVHKNKLFCSGFLGSDSSWALWRLDGSFTRIYAESDQGGTNWNQVWTVQIGHPGLFTDPATGDLICFINGARESNNAARNRVLRFQNADVGASPTRSYLDTTVLGAVHGGDAYLEGGGLIDFNMRWIVTVDSKADPTAPRVFLTARRNSGALDRTWEWKGVAAEIEPVASSQGISPIYAQAINRVGGGHRSPRAAAVEIGDVSNPIVEAPGGTKFFFRGRGTAAAAAVTFYGGDDETSPVTVVPIVAASLVVGAGMLTGLLAYYQFNESSGTRGDSSVNGLDLTETGTVGTGAGVFGLAGDFPGTSGNYLSRAGDDPLLDIGQSLAPFGISLWVNVDTVGAFMRLVGKSNETTDGWILIVTNDGRVQFAAHPSSPVMSLASVALSINVAAGLQHVLVTSDGVTGRMYLDGVEVDTAAAAAINNSASRFFVGQRFQNDSHLFGLLDELAIWNRYITPAEAAALFNSGSGKLLTDPTGLPTTPTISGNTIINLAPDNGSTLYSIVLDTGAAGVDIGEGDVGIIIPDFV